MQRIFLIIGLLIVFSTALLSQNNDAEITNIKMSVENGDVVIQYDIENSKANDLFNIVVYFSDEYYTKNYYLENLTGDVGKNVNGGKNKIVKWEIQKDMDIIRGNIIPFVEFENPKLYKNMGGASNALLSLACPGLGDYFVADHKKMKFKPYYKTALSLGCITLGVISAKKRYRERYWSPPHIETVYSYHYNGNYWTSHPEDKLFPGRWVDGEMKNYLFPGDVEAFIGLGVAVWLIDVLWVASKGKKNMINKKTIKNISSFFDNTEFNYQSGFFQMNYVIKL